MRQPKAVGRTLGNAGRVALTTVGAGLVVGAAAPLASAATLPDTASLASSATIPDSAPLASSATIPVTTADALSKTPSAAAPLTPSSDLADTALTTSEAALNRDHHRRLVPPRPLQALSAGRDRRRPALERRRHQPRRHPGLHAAGQRHGRGRPARQPTCPWSARCSTARSTNALAAPARRFPTDLRTGAAPCALTSIRALRFDAVARLRLRPGARPSWSPGTTRSGRARGPRSNPDRAPGGAAA